jgi:hypothetical protein
VFIEHQVDNDKSVSVSGSLTSQTRNIGAAKRVCEDLSEGADRATMPSHGVNLSAFLRKSSRSMVACEFSAWSDS